MLEVVAMMTLFNFILFFQVFQTLYYSWCTWFTELKKVTSQIVFLVVRPNRKDQYTIQFISGSWYHICSFIMLKILDSPYLAYSVAWHGMVVWSTEDKKKLLLSKCESAYIHNFNGSYLWHSKLLWWSCSSKALNITVSNIL